VSNARIRRKKVKKYWGYVNKALIDIYNQKPESSDFYRAFIEEYSRGREE